MVIEKAPFVNYRTDEEKELEEKGAEVVSVKFNIEEFARLQEVKKRIEQPKDSTAIKFLMELGTKVILEPKTEYVIDALFKYKRNNKRTGLVEF